MAKNLFFDIESANKTSTCATLFCSLQIISTSYPYKR